jgi:hypothetical protein
VEGACLDALTGRLQAAGADLLANFATSFKEGRFLDVRPELSLGVPHGETHIVPGERFLAANFTFSHNFT